MNLVNCNFAFVHFQGDPTTGRFPETWKIVYDLGTDTQEQFFRSPNTSEWTRSHTYDRDTFNLLPRSFFHSQLYSYENPLILVMSPTGRSERIRF